MAITHNYVSTAPAVDGKVDSTAWNADHDIAGDLVTDGMIRQGETWHAYGGFQNENYEISLADQNVWYQITNAENDLWTGLEADGLTLSADVMTFTNAADYIGAVSITLSGSNGKDFEIRLYNNTKEEQMGYVLGVTTTGDTNYASINLPLYIEADAGDEMQVEMRCTSAATDNPQLKSAVFYIVYLHD